MRNRPRWRSRAERADAGQPEKGGAKLCAIYTRKSTDENLDQAFNSLDSQREYCQAFIKSREPEGWQVCPTEYTDGGWSGGNMDRPGLQSLLADARAGKFQVVVCYKYDRLSRNTKDFLEILDIFDRHGVAFVSVTQPIDTTSSVGRLMRSILVDFSQFERELISERTRDKLAGMAKKGKRTGGHPILGYNIEKKALEVNDEEAGQVMEMFQTYLKTKSLSATAKALNGKGYSMKRWTSKNGKTRGGRTFNKATLFNLLRNPLYIGRIVHRGQEYPGEHKGIVSEELFEQVDRLLSRNANGRVHKDGYGVKHNFLLRGLLQCAACGTTMTPYSCINRFGQRFAYYKCLSANKMDKTACPVRTVPAKALEDHVIRRMAMLSKNRALVDKVVAKARAMSTQDLPARRDEKRVLGVELSRVEGGLKNLMGHLAQEGPASPRRDRLMAEMDELMAKEKGIRERLDPLEQEIIELETRQIDADLVQRNLGNFLKVFDRLSDSDKRELLALLIARVIYDKKCSRLTIALNPLPDLWGGVTSLEAVLVDRQISLPD